MIVLLALKKALRATLVLLRRAIAQGRLLVALVTSFVLVGCIGVTEYKITTPDGVIVEVRNTKDYETYTLNAHKEADGSYSVMLEETGVSASNPLKAMQEANAKLIDKIMSFIPGNSN